MACPEVPFFVFSPFSYLNTRYNATITMRKIGFHEAFDGGLNSWLYRVPQHKHICVDLFLRGTMFALFF